MEATGSASAGALNPPATGDQAQLLVRSLRHEVGDFLQLVYSTLALLEKQLPADAAGQRALLTNLRARAAGCKTMLDTVSDFICPVALDREAVNLVALSNSLVEAVSSRYPELIVRLELTGPVPRCRGDRDRLGRVANLLLLNACERARHEVVIRLGAGAGQEVRWSFGDDGPGIPDTQLDSLFQPFAASGNSRSILGLAPARKIVALHGGRVTAANPAQGGLQITIVLPVGSANSEPDGAEPQ